MKKLIVFSVIFALLASVAFAADVSGTVYGLVKVAEGTNQKDHDDIGASGGWSRVRVEASGETDEGTAGGYVRLDRSPWWAGLPEDATAIVGNVWWKPIDQFKLLIGGNGKDGFFGMDGVTRWGFYQVATDLGFFKEDWAFSKSFYQGFDENGVVITVNPMEALEINIGVPYFDRGGSNDGDLYPYMHAQVAYNIDGVGKLGITYKGGKNKLGADLSDLTKPEYAVDAATMFLYFNLSSIENIGLDIGLGYTFPVTYDEDILGFKIKATYTSPIAVGVGFTLNADPITLKARVQGQFAGKTEFEAAGVKGESKMDTVVDFDVLPSYAISDNTAVVLDAGLKVTLPDEGDTVIGWHVQPAVTVKAGWWAPTFYAGFRLSSDGVKGSSGDGDAAKVDWSIPIGLALSF